MGKQYPSSPTISAEDLDHGMVVIPMTEGGIEAVVIRYQWIDSKRGRLTTDLGVRVVNHTDRFILVK